MEPTTIIKDCRLKMQKAVEHLMHEFNALHTGKASPVMVESVVVDVYGSHMHLKEMAAITTPDARSISIEPWDKGTLKAIEKAIQLANMGFNPAIFGNTVRCPIPELSRERRQQLAKRAHGMAEESKVSVRSARQHAIENLKKSQKARLISEDDLKRFEKEVQNETDKMNAEIAKHLAHKEKELLQV
jgi:ribosome recycling factor